MIYAACIYYVNIAYLGRSLGFLLVFIFLVELNQESHDEALHNTIDSIVYPMVCV